MTLTRSLLIIGLVLGSVLAVLAFGHPQWNRWIFIFQYEFMYDDGLTECPEEHTGVWRQWYRNGQLKSVTEYLNGHRHGRDAYWEDNGDIIYDNHYKEGRKFGQQLGYEYGALHEKLVYGEKSRGDLKLETILLQEEYYDNGNVKLSYQSDASGQPKIDWKYFRSGQVAGITTYDLIIFSDYQERRATREIRFNESRDIVYWEDFPDQRRVDSILSTDDSIKIIVDKKAGIDRRAEFGIPLE